ncbi:MAG: 50S ribosomal protein L21 [Bacillota bacterium]
MFAVIQTGGKQYKVAESDYIKVEKLNEEVGTTIELPVLMYTTEEGTTIGAPVVEGVTVKCEVLRQDKAKKIIVYKYKAKKNVRKKRGHRQSYTLLKVVSIAKA